jgi:hypothetical protein
MRRRVAAIVASLLCLTGCTTTFDVAPSPDDDELYARLYPYYAEFCAVSQIRKKPGFGVDTSGGWGGHSVLYLNGVCRVRDAGYPTIELCPDDASAGQQGVGFSVNAHFKNANWIATDGPGFFFHGNVSPRGRLTRAAYRRTQNEAKKKGLLDGVVFHREVFDDMPAGMGRRDFMYEVSIATDYAIGFGRDRYCARVPLTRAQMSKTVAYLNSANAVYRDGKKDFQWNVLQNNCTYLAHNALAAAGIWDYWEPERFVLIAALDFPVPKNEFVDLMRRTNDTDISDPRRLYADPASRRELMENDRLPVEPGALARAEPVMQKNDVYETRLHLIFYDNTIGSYERRFRTIFSEPRYTDIAANLRHVATLYRQAAAQRRPLPVASQEPTRDDFAVFHERFYDHLERDIATVDSHLAALDHTVAMTRRP